MNLIVNIDEEQYQFIKQSMTIDKIKDYHALLFDICGHIANGIPLDNIRADINQLPTTKCTETRRIYIDADDFKENVLAIIDRYMSESEDDK